MGPPDRKTLARKHTVSSLSTKPPPRNVFSSHDTKSCHPGFSWRIKAESIQNQCRIKTESRQNQCRMKTESIQNQDRVHTECHGANQHPKRWPCPHRWPLRREERVLVVPRSMAFPSLLSVGENVCLSCFTMEFAMFWWFTSETKNWTSWKYLQDADIEVRTSKCGYRSADFGVRISKCGFRNADIQTRISK